MWTGVANPGRNGWGELSVCSRRRLAEGYGRTPDVGRLRKLRHCGRAEIASVLTSTRSVQPVAPAKPIPA